MTYMVEWVTSMQEPQMRLCNLHFQIQRRTLLLLEHYLQKDMMHGTNR